MGSYTFWPRNARVRLFTRQISIIFMRFVLMVVKIGVPLLRSSNSRELALCVVLGWLPFFLVLGRSSVAPVLLLHFITLHGFCYYRLDFKPLTDVKCKGVKYSLTFFSIHPHESVTGRPHGRARRGLHSHKIAHQQKSATFVQLFRKYPPIKQN